MKSAWNIVTQARSLSRPKLGDYLKHLVEDFEELHGDRCYGDDPAMTTGLGRIGSRRVMIVGTNKGRDTKEQIARNFGYPKPEGYRKALAKIRLAEKFSLPVVTLIDTPGAYPGPGAEERGQAQAIAMNLREMSRLRVPVVCVITGEGGSGGAIGIGAGDRLAILENAYYSIISPEGCAAILWRDASKREEAAEALKLTSWELFRLGLVDTVILEGANGGGTIPNVKSYVLGALRELDGLSVETMLSMRYKRLRSIGSLSR